MNETLLKKRMAEAPRMEPTDAVKLAYQSAFGCGHLLTDRASCLAALARELAQTPADPSAPAATPVGGKLCRLNLAAPAVRALSAERLVGLMELTERRVLARPGNLASFREALALLRGLAQAGETPFSLGELEKYLTEYEAMGCPPVSHSPGYRAAYHPAYRVAWSDFAPLLPLIAELDERLATPESAPVVVVLDGPCGAGKTTLAQLLAELYNAPVLHMDDFFLPPPLRTPARLAEKGGNIHYERFESEVLSHLASADGFAYRRYDCATGQMLPRFFPAARLRVAEGSYSLHPRFWPAYDGLNAVTAFVEAEEPERRARLRLRNPESFRRFADEWIPLEKSYFQAYDIRRRARFVLQSLPWEESL